MSVDKTVLWTVMPLLGGGTYLLRLSFLGILGGSPLPRWLVRCLRYTAVGVLPGLVAPSILWPAATGGDPDAARILAAMATLVVGITFRSMLAGILGGALTLYLVPVLIG